MRVPSWEVSPGALLAFLSSGTKTHKADLFTFTTQAGVLLARYTAADITSTVNGVTYGTGPIVSRSQTRLNVGITVDTMDVVLAADASVTINGVPLLVFIAGGGLDGARLSLDRAFATAPGAAWIGSLALFNGRVNEVVASRYEASLTVNSDSELLNVNIPRNVYQPSCLNTLYDAACGVTRTGFAVNATSATDATLTSFNCNTGLAGGYFDLGFAVCNTGANAGIQRTIKMHTGASQTITTIQPWPAAVAIGDTFTLYAGCDKTKASCTTKFANAARFRAFPFIPAPESVT
jgi:uncharacterized phage protein (TIGR02218 family)